MGPKFSTDGLYELLQEFRSEVRDELASIHAEVKDLRTSRDESSGRDKVIGAVAGAASGGMISWLVSVFGAKQ